MKSDSPKSGKFTFRRSKGVARMADILRFAAWLGNKMGFSIECDDFEYVRTQGNTMRLGLTPGAGGSAANDHNWKPTRVDSTHLTISVSTAWGGYPTIGGTSILNDPPPQLTVSASNLEYVYVKVVVTNSTSGGYVTGSTVASRTIAAYASPQTSTNTDLYYLLFTWQAGEVVTQSTFWNFSGITRDDGSSTSTPEHLTWV